MQCSSCKKTIASDSKYCSFCGFIQDESMPQNKTHCIRIGRANDNDFIVSNPFVSAHHCIIYCEAGGRLRLKDLDSANGVYVKGKKISDTYIDVSDVLHLSNKVKIAVAEIIKSKIPSPAIAPIPHIEVGAKDFITIGRDPGNDIVLKNIKVSRHHARLEKIGSAWQLIDTNSANGVFVNGKKISSSLISQNDKITIGGIPLFLDQLFVVSKPDYGSNLNIVAHNIRYSVGSKVIVDNMSLMMQSGQFIGLIGPSGCGKTTFMMMMNGYLKPSDGDVLINGVSLYQNAEVFQGQIGYVPQDDIIHRELTVEESLWFTSKLRLGNKISSAERQSLVSKTISELKLNDAKDVLIGSPEKKGISGGQRKRVNMAQELITEPLLYFLDEPTSGLDPLSDKEVMLMLKEMANEGHIVLLTTHKIDKLNFSLFSHLIVLGSGGKLLYYGEAADAVSFFGVSNPEEIFYVLGPSRVNEWHTTFKQSNYYKKLCILPTAVSDHHSLSDALSHKHRVWSQPDWWYQYHQLCIRNLLIKSRDHFGTAILLLQAPIIGLFINLVFKDSNNLPSLYFVLVVAAIWLGCSNSAREIVSEQTVFKREHKASLNLDAYLCSKISVLSVLCILQCIVLSLFAINTASLNIDSGILVFALSLISIAGLCMGLMLSATVKTGEAAMALVPVALIPQVILGGLIVSYCNLPEGVNVIAGFMLSRWAFELLLILEDNSLFIDNIGFNHNGLHIGLLVITFMCILLILWTRFLLFRKMR